MRALLALLVLAWSLPAFAGDFTMPGERGKVRVRGAAFTPPVNINYPVTITNTTGTTLLTLVPQGATNAKIVTPNQRLIFNDGTQDYFGVIDANFRSLSTGAFTWSSSSSNISAADVSLTRKGAANLQLGAADAAAPVAQTLSVQSVVAGTSNTNGTNWTLKGSAGTGTGTGGSLILQTALAGTTGTAQNAQQTAVTIDQKSHVGFSSAAIPTIGTCGGGSPAVTAGSTDIAGAFTTGTTATACTLTFKQAFTTAPFCVLDDITVKANVTAYTISTTALVLTMASNSGDVVDYLCHGI